jgi:hypothetical protein
MGMAMRKPTPLKRVFVALIVLASVAFALTATTSDRARIQAPERKPLLADSNIPEPVRAILERACGDCHSQNTVWPLYSHIPPISWQIRGDVEKGRAFMDLSKWNTYTEAQRKGFTVAIAAAVQSHLMPPEKYRWMHRGARLSAGDVESIRTWAFVKRRR